MPAVVNSARFVGNRDRHFVDEVCVPGGGLGDGYGEQGRRFGPPHAVEALVPFVGTQPEAFKAGAVVVEGDAFLFEGHAGDEIGDALVERGGGVEIERMLDGQRGGQRIRLGSEGAVTDGEGEQDQ